ncbi:PAS/PAC sensor hybrid histidine kinase [Treponema primitia ZAS-2]|uniref:histidine kinase n=1 Tax=Treponema primitia (strain ATCC BAA-887 / DSM 12427 / ZAS-2) TaxID=545694 RepID=F5YLS8_TREPZ|nr:ATP-binding protein [Treponema primitia]AEF83714.1 PAS/PAC sensor hybrid histidine kinase [Treponema primitia ZAS-2]
MKKPAQFAIYFLLAAVLIGAALFFPRPKNSVASPFRVALSDCPIYAKNGFTFQDIIREFSPLDWEAVALPKQGKPSLIIKDILGLKSSRPFLAPWADADQEFTMAIPFEVDTDAMRALRSSPPVTPGIYLAGIGDNWEIYLNGFLVHSEIHLDPKGQITKHRTRRGAGIPVYRDIFHTGTNILAIRIISPPGFDYGGLFYSAPHFIDDYRIVMRQSADQRTLIFCTVYIFVGLYTLMLFFLMRREEKYNFYYGIFSVMTGIYFIARSPIIHNLISDSAITQKIEYSALYILVFFLASFIEQLNFNRILLPAKLYGLFCFVLIVLQSFFSTEFADDALNLWRVVCMFMLIFVLGHDVIFTFCKDIHRQWKKHAYAKWNLLKVIQNGLTKTLFGNIVTVIIFLSLTAVVDTLDAAFIHTGIFLTRYSFFFVTTGMTIALAKHLTDSYNQVHQQKAELEILVGERTRELAEQVKIAESASRAKSEFLATMSHEIRTPLNAIIGLSNIVLEKALPETAHGSIEKIRVSGVTLLGIINDILDISKIETGNFEIIPVEYSTASLISESVRLNMVRIGEKPISFELSVSDDLPETLFGDELRIKQILNNILSNGIKYTKAGKVRLEITHEPFENGILLILKVSDTGIGIKQEDREKLFTEYSQLDTRANRKIEGTGLGLSITKKLLTLMNGTISVESEYGKGSTFTMTLPQKTIGNSVIGKEIAEMFAALRFMEESRNPVQDLKRAWMPYGRVLVVDDVAINLEVAQGLLEPYGLRVECASSGMKAIEMIKDEKHPYDLVLMDHMMPEMDGIETVRIIRNEIGTEYAKNIPIAALTANALTGNEAMFLANGFNGFVSKPIDIMELDEMLNKWVKAKQSAETLAQAEKERPGAAEAEKNESEKPVPGLDIPGGIKRYNSEKIYKRILTAYSKSAPAMLDTIREPNEKNLSDYMITVHGLKGASRGIDAVEIGNMAEELEFAAKAGDFQKLTKKNSSFIEAAEKLISDIRLYLDSQQTE